ncbi:hypothetical protein [Pseudophaeobacter sp. A-200-2]|uniref:hypothetical protein n=1 Tax=Pseudophaeobacter sp. A-200-2 TaxID=3098145 RepID=UPI0034D7A52C
MDPITLQALHRYIKDLTVFYSQCVRASLTQTYYALLGWISFFVTVVASIVQYLGSDLPPFLQIMNSDAAVHLPLLLAGSVFGIRLLDAPYKRYRDEHQRRCELEERRKPRLSVQVTEPNGSDQCTTIVNETEGGYRFPHERLEYRNALYLTVKNNSEVRVGPCVAILTKVERKTPSGFERMNFAEGIRLPWNIDNLEGSLEQTIEAETHGRVWIASVDYNGNAWLLRDTEQLQSDQRLIFGESGTYHAKVQVSDGSSRAQSVSLELEVGPSPNQSYTEPGLATLRIT